MKDRPILFSAPMVRAILEGRKTQTRRIMKPQPVTGPGGSQIIDGKSVRFCLGDRLWVRETWCKTRNRYLYRASCCDDKPSANTDDWDAPIDDRWKPSIHMPRAASRITLEVTGLRVERVQDITEADAVAEGVTETFDSAGGCHERTTAAENFRALWEQINGVQSWAESPWVWVVEFRRAQP